MFALRLVQSGRFEEAQKIMVSTPRELSKDKGFWDGGGAGHGSNKESSGRPSGLPGMRKPSRVGVNTDIDSPPVPVDASKE